MGFIPPPKLKPGDRPTAEELNSLRSQVYALGRPVAQGNIGVEQSGYGLQITDLSQTEPLARITSRGAGANYGWNQVIDNGDGTFTDQPTGLPDIPWGTPTAAPAWELGGRTDVPAGLSTDTPPGAIVRLYPGGQDKANFYFRYGESGGKSFHVKLTTTGTGECEGTAWAGRIQELDGAGAVIDGDYLGPSGTASGSPKYVLYPTKAEDGTVQVPKAGDIGIAIPDPNRPTCFLFRPKRPFGFECGQSKWFNTNTPHDQCFKILMAGGEGQFAGMPNETASEIVIGGVEYGNAAWYEPLQGWLTVVMKQTCCGCGGVLFKITGPGEAKIVFDNFHGACTGSGGCWSVDLTFVCDGINPVTGQRYAKFVGYDDRACDDEPGCANAFWVIVECAPCPPPICQCCCESVAPWAWTENITGFADANRNCRWIWTFDPTAENCTWRAFCPPTGKTSTLEYVPGASVMRLTHDGVIYEKAIAEWTCHGNNDMAYVSGASGDHPGSITVRPIGYFPDLENPCELPDTLSVSISSAGCPIFNTTKTVTRVGMTNTWVWEADPIPESGVTLVTLSCGAVPGQGWKVSATAVCDDDPTPKTFGLQTDGIPDTQLFDPIELEWLGQEITQADDDAVAGCCQETTDAIVQVSL